MKYCLIGSGIGRSLSPLIHKMLFQAEGVTGEYDLFDDIIMPDLRKVLAEYPRECSCVDPSEGSVGDEGKGFGGGTGGVLSECVNRGLYEGINITAPFKIQAAAVLKTEGVASAIDAVNCAFRGRGYNTDYTAFSEELEVILTGLGITIKTALIIGRGGVASAIAFALRERKIDFAVATRDSSPMLRSVFLNARTVDVDSAEAGYDLIINATPYGRDLLSPPIIDERVVGSSRFVFDALYHDTSLCSAAKRCGIPYKNGLKMLILQAIHSHRIWGLPYKRVDPERVFSEIQRTGLINL